MDMQALNQIVNKVNAQRYNSEISHRAWFITIQCVAQTVETAGYTWDQFRQLENEAAA